MRQKEIPKYIDTIPKSDKLRRLVWQIMSYVLFKPFSLPFFRAWRIAVLRFFGAKLHKTCNVYASVYIPSPWNLEMGEQSTLGPEVKLHLGKTVIGRKVLVSQRTYLCSATHQIDSLNTPLVIGAIYLQDFAWIAAETFIMSGVTVGEGAVVGARAAVFKDVTPWTVIGGNPAKLIKKRAIRNINL
ncbi:putative colanic acid biosynthesis acetyltransferase [Sphingobacterium allocomposti]|nr:putative colanic acid biosynthesis acetyltransferase [Sphingobacterium composti Yoo et al. 2007 non Ten et al. 2007]